MRPLQARLRHSVVAGDGGETTRRESFVGRGRPVNNAIAEHQPGQSVTLRACKARLRTLMDCHRKDEMALLRA